MRSFRHEHHRNDRYDGYNGRACDHWNDGHDRYHRTAAFNDDRDGYNCYVCVLDDGDRRGQ